MNITNVKFLKVLGFIVILGTSGILTAGEIIVWHSLESPLGDKFSAIIERFNQKPANQAAKIKVIPEYKGTYEQTLYAGLKSVGSKKAPHILQVYEMGNLVMQANPKAYVPLGKLTSTPSPLFNPNRFLPSIASFYKARNGDSGLPSLPFSASTVVLFYNKNAFKAVGLDPEKPPTTWEEFEIMAPKLKKLGGKNILGGGWLSAHQIDQMAAWHHQPVATQGNGVDGEPAELVVNTPFFIHHLGKLASWYQENIFSLETRIEAERAFANGDLAMLIQGPGRLPLIEELVGKKFEMGVGKLPYWQQKVEAPQNTIAGGASFWAIAGHSPEEYQAIQSFFEYLVSSEVQTEWHQEACYMPVILGVKEISEKQNFYQKGVRGRALLLALDSYTGRLPKEYSRGILLPQFPKIRGMMDQQMMEAIKGHKTPEEALNQIVFLGNKIIKKESKR